jgi:mRNA interferase MazF
MISQRDIVLLSFPFSDLRSSKVRPAIVLSNDQYNRKSKDFVAVPLTTNLKVKDYALLITNKELDKGKLIADSKVKIDRIFSVEQRLVRMTIGKVKKEVHYRIKNTLSDLID